ncbi:MAG: hypothetical protein ABSB09_12975 [Acidimicrobiales bacterium]|jgi:hypothetical protein
METLLRYVQRKAFGRGMRGYNTAWFVVGAAVWMLLRARRGEEVVYRTKLNPGERLVISSSPRGSTSSPDS